MKYYEMNLFDFIIKTSQVLETLDFLYKYNDHVYTGRAPNWN